MVPCPCPARSPPLAVPRLLKEGVSEGQVKAHAEKATAFLNKALGAVGAGPSAPVAVAARLCQCVCLHNEALGGAGGGGTGG